ncbi:jerky protein homolog-like [Photinus pyralis]|nr:jerky protein homolog-like [Photinus pyralis]
MAPKRKHKTLSIKQKSEIIERLNKGESGKVLVAEYGVGRSTICDIKKKKAKIDRFIGQCESAPGLRKTLRKAEYAEMETRLYAWFCRQRSRHVPISYEILSAKARQFYTETYGNDNFRASRGWICNFRKRHSLRALKVCGEKLSNDQSVVNPFLTTFKEKVRQLNLVATQIYNADESALYWKMLPEKTLVRSQEKTAPGRKISKERVTFLACCNANGSHKLKMLVIGKAKNPRAFKNADIPVEYKSSANAWMTTTIFYYT